MAADAGSAKVYRRVLGEIFSGRVTPGSQLVERQLADQLGVSRIPVRETLLKLVGQGVLVGGEKGQGVRVRDYTSEQVRELYQFREMMEGGAARAAATAASADDLLSMEMICDQMDEVAGESLSPRWADLDHRFHQAMAAASHHERFIYEMQTLLGECHYVFFGPGSTQRAWLALDEAETQALHHEVMGDHRQLLAAIQRRDGGEAERLAREHMSKSADRIMRARIARRFTEES